MGSSLITSVPSYNRRPFFIIQYYYQVSSSTNLAHKMIARSAPAKNFPSEHRSTEKPTREQRWFVFFDGENTTTNHIYLLMETYSEKMKRKREEANANRKQQHPVKKSKLLPESVDKTVIILLGMSWLLNSFKQFFSILKYLNDIILGPPAIGKGTQAALLSKQYSLHHISMGELLRAASEEEGERGQYIREHWTVSDRY